MSEFTPTKGKTKNSPKIYLPKLKLNVAQKLAQKYA